VPNRDDGIFSLLMDAIYADQPGQQSQEAVILIHKAASLCRDPAIQNLVKDLAAENAAKAETDTEKLGLPDDNPDLKEVKKQLLAIRRGEYGIASVPKLAEALWTYLDESKPPVKGRPQKKGFQS